MKYIYFLLSLSLLVLASVGSNDVALGDSNAQDVVLDVNICSEAQVSVDEFQKNVSDFRSALHWKIQLTTGIKRQLLREVDSVLQLIELRINQLPQLLRDVIAKTQQNVKNAQDNLVRLWQSWASQQLKAFLAAKGANVKLQAAKDTLSDYIIRFTNSLIGCGDEVQVQLNGFYGSVQQVIAKYKSSLTQLKSTSQASLEVDDNDSVALKSCVNATRKDYLSLQNVAVDAVNLVNQGQRLLLAHFDQSVCVVKVIAQFEQEKLRVLQSLLGLVQNKDDGENNADGGNNADGENNAEGQSNADEESNAGGENNPEGQSNADEESNADGENSTQGENNADP